MEGLTMHRLLYLLLGIGILSFSSDTPIRAQTPAGDAVYAVSYVDATPSGRSRMIAALKQYRDASRKDAGYVRVDLLEQVGRPGHFAVIEAWRDQQAFDAHGSAAHVQQFRDAIRPVRVSGYDERPYRPISVASPRAAAGGQAVQVVAHVDIAAGGAKIDAAGMLRRLAEASRNDQGSLLFEVLQHAMRANHFTVVEVWQNQDALDAHAAAAHARQYRDELQPVSGSPLDERVYKAIE
jgi:quinol monooxygenase YgiN